MKKKLTFGSVCSGIEASQLAFSPFGYQQLWSSEIAEFPSKVLNHHYPNIPNLGNMTELPEMILQGKVQAPDLFCGGTPCQAFSLAGWKNGLEDKRGQLTITFIEIANAIDEIRKKEKKDRSIVLWENVEGVLNDKTNAFGNFIAGLAGFDDEIKVNKWTKSGYLEGKSRNVAWRVIDAKYFGLPQQRKRLYVLAGGKDFRPDQVLFEFDTQNIVKEIKANKQEKSNENVFNLFSESNPKKEKLVENVFYKNNNKFEFFREYTDCLYAAYGTKWNGNAAAYNGSLYIAQEDRIRRLTPLECERLMGFPDNYTSVNGNSNTNRYQAIGNSWAIPVIKWIGSQINNFLNQKSNQEITCWYKSTKKAFNNLDADLFLLENVISINQKLYLNSSAIPNTPIESSIKDIIQVDNVPEKFYLSPQACKGILRRKAERNIKMNIQLEKLMTEISLSEKTLKQA
ncbi:DNA (cytosine-5-)-methyltransferase [Flavobacterium sp. TR2]|uniref:DNA cytosine methyltransferase n=1 Tax=Flavobacterium sp. TR2 TaxID=2977321 RepID=UPI0021B1158D|nr:DNA (cytosine-5-)-methyltransferase [Flavobacterium sp. TR2]UWY29579.1 DNA (cytosine-5-)-methyltransferase [Flavobacterium sp. TR2]